MTDRELIEAIKARIEKSKKEAKEIGSFRDFDLPYSTLADIEDLITIYNGAK
jgi:hypothetical protein